MSEGRPLVTVILTTYNQAEFVGETLLSVIGQSYPHIQLIIIDNASQDGTVAKIEAFLEEHPVAGFTRNSSNAGLCKAFNTGLASAEGKYVIDLSGDDIMLPDRIEKQVAAFEKLPDHFVVVFSNARYLSAAGEVLHHHYQTGKDGKAVGFVPQGDVYKQVLEKYFICTPTMMMRTHILRQIGGYDETLSFEDFDFWVRTSVKYYYHYVDEVLTYKRITPNSLGTQVICKGSGILDSCYTVCNKAYDLNRDQEEFDLLAHRIRSFIRKCWYAQEFELAIKFRRLLNYIENPGLQTELIVFLCRLHIPINGLYRFYLRNIQKTGHSRKDLAFRFVSTES
ncbi:hypothetical protein DYBT9275_00840 [Dyadobacter sp. CECT 9275]|uniref:Glycosyltransferase 2-like domain-containing protein n=1 Tax=Dyadobacter helix TaxID=2822344 RepID=A0A916J949_9BACT|nr:glycosyltransferase [Dyadobacter sp. CECT 9275]CAG4991842.1 hypothetical protein DYBT9275_00840 [Dyadobacter sp. CECT 9275]